MTVSEHRHDLGSSFRARALIEIKGLDRVKGRSEWKCEHGTLYSWDEHGETWYLKQFHNPYILKDSYSGRARVYLGCDCKAPCSPREGRVARAIDLMTTQYRDKIINPCSCCGNTQFLALHLADAGRSGEALAIQCLECGTPRYEYYAKIKKAEEDIRNREKLRQYKDREYDHAINHIETTKNQIRVITTKLDLRRKQKEKIIEQLVKEYEANARENFANETREMESDLVQLKFNLSKLVKDVNKIPVVKRLIAIRGEKDE